MGNIRQLDPILSNQIAAGEVIERPANVVKELVENSIDAKSKHIYIYCNEGGLSFIKVVDDGCGMDEEDALMCFQTHATSKIKTNFDLFNITTLGFRGEAIPSIASVAILELATSTGNVGTKVVYEYGKMVSKEVTNAKKGTTITVTKLFQNLPARLKYMKSVAYEFSRILSLVERFALSNPFISFHLYHQDKLIFQSNGNGKMIDIFGQIFGLAVARNMVEIKGENEDFKVNGFVSRIDTTRSNKNYIITLINNRVVKASSVIEAVNSTYRDYLASDRYPIALISVEIDPYLVDVNVHPSKMEVRFSKEDELSKLVSECVINALKQENLIYEPKNVVTEKVRPVVQPAFNFEEPVSIKDEPIVTINEEPMVVKEATPVYEVQEKPSYHVETVKPILKKIYAKAQIHGTYIVAENQEGLYLVDQHAAKERINYEFFKEKFIENMFSYQDLLIPIIIKFAPSDYLVLKERKDLIQGVGIDLEEFGEHTFVVKKLPIWMKEIDERIYIETMCESVIHTNKLDVLSMQEDAIATLACKASVKGNTYLSLPQMQALCDDLMRIENPYVCPHGRPTMIFYSGYELEKLFKRVV